MTNSYNTIVSFRVMAIMLFFMVFGIGINGMVNNDNKKFDRDGILKTIVSGDEIIDCVDIYKQPAFNNPLLKNHTLQLKPSSYLRGSRSKVVVNSTKYIQMWHKNGEYCPKGTIAMLRSSTTTWAFKDIEVAGVSSSSYDYYGLNMDMSVWSPQTQPNEMSSSQVWMFGGDGFKVQSFQAGWMVTPLKPKPTIFAYWTRDATEVSGCYNLDCPGFVQTSSTIVLGSQLNPVSIYGGQQFFINLKIHKDFKTGNWWLNIQGTDVGYWPGDLLPSMKISANVMLWGGKVSNTKPKGVHTRTQMGSGHFPSEGFGKAAWFKNLEYVDDKGSFQDVRFIQTTASDENCYDAQVQDWDQNFGTHFLYGGPGYSSICQN